MGLMVGDGGRHLTLSFFRPSLFFHSFSLLQGIFGLMRGGGGVVKGDSQGGRGRVGSGSSVGG